MQKYTVEADAGSMALGKGSFIATYSNSMGDGRFNVLVFDNESEFDSHEKEKPYRKYEFLSSVEGDFDLYDYDQESEAYSLAKVQSGAEFIRDDIDFNKSFVKLN